ncbi:MAG: enterochelin esterase, partial [Gemmatimonadetes bacterium]|nr:enterochelin esterase [Gemmatimonadota bacterium]
MTPATSPAKTPRLAIRELERKLPLTREDVDAFLEKHDFPLAEETSVTFAYRGMADAVNLRHWVFGLQASQPFRRIPGTDLWYLILELPKGSRVEYKLEVVRGPHSEWIEDPMNPHLAQDPFGANSICQATGYEIPEWSRPNEETRPGKIEHMDFESEALGETRSVGIYYPARYRESRRYPLLVVHDGADYVRYAELKNVLDNLIHRQEIPGMIVAMTDSARRLEEYVDHEGHARFLADELVPHLEETLPLHGTPRHRGLMGASLGAVASLSAAARYPNYFSRLLLQSGSFAFSDIGLHERGPIFDPIAEFVNRYR